MITLDKTTQKVALSVLIGVAVLVFIVNLLQESSQEPKIYNVEQTQKNQVTESKPAPETKKEDVVLIGSTKEQILEEFKDWEKDSDYEIKVDPNALKFTKTEVMVVVDFNSKGIAEGVSFLSNNFNEIDKTTGQGAYADTHYDELVKWAIGGKQIKIEKNKSTQYPVEIYIGNIHE